MTLNDLRIGTRLALAFGLLVSMLGGMGWQSLKGIAAIQGTVVGLYDVDLPGLDYLLEVDRDLHQLLVAERSMMFADVSSPEFKAQMAAYKENLQQSEERWVAFRGLQQGADRQAEMVAYEASRSQWLAITRQIVEGRASDTREGRRLALDLSLGEGARAFETMREHLNKLQEQILADTEKGRLQARVSYRDTVLTTAIILVADVLAAIVLAALITRGITRRLKRMTALADEIAQGRIEVGDIGFQSRDELGRLAVSFGRMADVLRTKGKAIERIAGGDLTTDVDMASDKDQLGTALSRMVAALHELVSQTGRAVGQINLGADQLAQSSQSLSQGATEQASALEEVSAALTQISGQSKHNAESATTANELARTAVANAERGNEQISGLVAAMEKMNAGSREITKIVKLIDDIAFQINLLALNANVEAARAGKYGKGFAVVAEEVRNLAVRSATAVRDTTRMVEETTGSISMGSKIAEATAGQFSGIVASVSKVADLLGEIAVASKEQADGVAQVTSGIQQVDGVTQANTASAEESAAASEELSGQIEQLGALVARFTIRPEQSSATPSAASRTGPAQRTAAGATTPPRPAQPGKPANGKTRQHVLAPPVARAEERRGAPSTRAPEARVVDPREVVRLDDDEFGAF
jgi:methyl-accepting chemotaxis protein